MCPMSLEMQESINARHFHLKLNIFQRPNLISADIQKKKKLTKDSWSKLKGQQAIIKMSVWWTILSLSILPRTV